MTKMAIFGFWAIFRGLARASKSKLRKNEEQKSGDIHPESPKYLTWPNLNKPATSQFGGIKWQKWLFLGSGPFSEGWHGPKNQNYGKVKKTSGDIHLESPKNLTWPNLNKPAPAKFGGTLSPKSPISAIFSLIKSPKMAKNQFLSQNDSRYINSPSK